MRLNVTHQWIFKNPMHVIDTINEICATFPREGFVGLKRELGYF